MPTGNCRHPGHHHSPGTGGPFGLLGAIALGAVVIAFWHTIVVALVIVTILACIAGAVFLLIHNHGSGYDPELEQRAVMEHRRRAAAERGQVTDGQQPAAIEAATVHNHLHLHGVSGDDMAEAARQFTRSQRPEIEEGRQRW